MTRYDCSQYMRNLETRMRDIRSQLLGGDSEKLKTQLNSIKNVYNQVAKKSGIAPQLERTKI